MHEEIQSHLNAFLDWCDRRSVAFGSELEQLRDQARRLQAQMRASSSRRDITPAELETEDEAEQRREHHNRETSPVYTKGD